MKNFMLLLFSSFTLCCCEKKENDKIFIEANIDVSYLSVEGKDLLNKDTPGYYKEENIDVYYFVKGEKVKIYDPQMGYPKSFFISSEKRSDLYFLRLFTYLYYNHIIGLDQNNHTITYIRFGDTVEDKIECEFKTYKENSSISCLKVWYNDSLVWQESMGERKFVIKRNN